MMRIVYAGSPDVAVTPLKALHDAGIEIVGVLSQPDRPVGRKKVLTPTPVTTAARELGLSVHHPANTQELADVVSRLQPDLAIAVAYGRLIPPNVLSMPVYGWWNLHFSLLPRWRGATPVQHALLHGDLVTGLTVFQMDEGLDTGAIVATRERRIRALDTASSLLHDLAVEGADVLVQLVAQLEHGALTFQPQEGEVTYAPKLTREDGRLVWSQPATDVMNRYRAVTPEPGAYAVVAGDGRQVGVTAMRPVTDGPKLGPGEIVFEGKKVLVGCGDDPIELVRVKPAGKVEMEAAAWWRGVDSETRFD